MFGSYGWGDGQWMRDWVSRFENAGAVIVGGEGVICVEAPDDEAVNACKSLEMNLRQNRKSTKGVLYVNLYYWWK